MLQKEQQNKISVAICTYNGAKYLSEELESIFMQTVLPGEIVICDDGSTDNTIEIIKKFKENEKIPIHLFENEKRLGIKKNFEKALLLCQGEYIFLADQDDLWKKDKVEKVISYFQLNPGINVIFTNALMLQQNQPGSMTIWDEVGFTEAKKEKLKDPALLLQQLFMYRNLTTGATMALRKSILDTYLPLPDFTVFLHDYLIALQAAAEGSLGWIDECLIYYRIHKGQKLGFNKNVPPYMKPLHYLYYGSKKRLSSNKRKQEKKDLAKHLLTFAGTNMSTVRQMLDTFVSG